MTARLLRSLVLPRAELRWRRFVDANRKRGERGFRVGDRLLLPAALVVLVAASFVFLELPGETRFWRALQNAGHGLAFAALAFVWLLSLGARRERRPTRLAALVAGVGLVLFGVGLGIELGQGLSGRGTSARDAILNLVGIGAGTALLLATRRVVRSGDIRRRGVRLFWLTIGLLALVWCVRKPIAIAVVDVLASELPIVATFDEPFALTRLAGGLPSARLRLKSAEEHWPNNSTTILSATFPPGVWPGFRLVEPEADWAAYEMFAIEVVNTMPKPVTFHLRVDQRAEGEDIFWSSSRTVMPGKHTVRFVLAEMRPDITLDSKRADHEPFRDVSQVLIFLSRNRENVTLLFDDFRLLR